MDLILWRHAEAHDARPGQDDLARPLTLTGQRHADQIGHWLHEALPADARVLASPAQRTQQTVRALPRPHETAPVLAPGAAPDAVLRAVGWPHGSGTVVLVGHNPTMGLLASLLLSGHAQHWRFAKAGVWWLRSLPLGASQPVQLLAVKTPDGP